MDWKGTMPLFDNHNRPINYLRLAVTDRCNLRCFYCMPAEGIKYLPKKALLTFEETERLISILAPLGITKVRLTGGEPFVRTDLVDLIKRIKDCGIDDIHITTNGILTGPYIPELKRLGIKSINLSLDTLDAERFKSITRRDEFEKTWATFLQLVDAGFELKVNTVVMEGQNVDDIIPIAQLAKAYPVSVRFIEEMPFNGAGAHYGTLTWTATRILAHLRTAFPGLSPVAGVAHATAMNYQVPDFQGNIGVIAAFSRTFCGTCNRIRITAQGQLKTCLYDNGVLDIRHLLRSGATDDDIENALLRAFGQRPKDGFEAERNRSSVVSESMSTIGG